MMKWNYKILMLIVIACTVFVVSNTLYRLALSSSYNTLNKQYELINDIAETACCFTLIIILKNHKERFWRTLPFYSLFIVTVLIYLEWCFNNFNTGTLSQSWNDTFITYVLGICILITYPMLLISSFTVKNKRLKIYFLLFGLSLILNVVATIVLKVIMPVSYSYIHLLFDVIPCIIIAVAHYNLYKQLQYFRPGDTVGAKVQLENVQVGTIGVIIKKHSNSNYFEVEFLDDKGNLINTLSIPGYNIAHAEVQSLEARVENFNNR